MHEDTWLVNMCAIRYALRRRTYISEVVASYTIDHIPLYHDVEVEKIIDEVQEELRECDCGDVCDRASWMDLVSACYKELEMRGKK